jgi:hypothetical protein
MALESVQTAIDIRIEKCVSFVPEVVVNADVEPPPSSPSSVPAIFDIFAGVPAAAAGVVAFLFTIPPLAPLGPH